MKFVYFGYDFMLPAIKRVIAEGHELLGIFTFECDNIFNFNQNCRRLAEENGIPFILSAAEDFHIESFLEKGAELFLAAGYPHKIPPVDESKAYAVNVHPTYLPKARGLMPIPRIIMGELKDAAGFTAHKMTQDFDAGDIVLQQKFNLDKQETVETYSSKIAIQAPDAFAHLVNNLPALWQKAKPQNQKKATYLTPPTNEERFFDWTKTVSEIDKTGRAFGRFGSLATFDNKTWVVFDYDFWEEPHNLEPGAIAAVLSKEIVMAAKNGFVCIKEFQHIKPV